MGSQPGNQEHISIVSACGVHEKYTGWAWDENSGISALLLDVSFKNRESDLAELGTKYRNYRSCMRDLVWYCPAGYFDDESMPNCDLVEQSQTYKVPGTGGNILSIGFGTYNPNCCRPCTTCPHFTKKDTRNWKACLGDSLSDTQDACVDRCVAMYWENKTASECRRCSTCRPRRLSCFRLISASVYTIRVYATHSLDIKQVPLQYVYVYGHAASETDNGRSET